MNLSDISPHSFPKPRPKYGFTFLLAVLLATFGLFPFLEDLIWDLNFLDLFITALALAGIYAVSNRRWVFIVGIFLAVSSVCFHWGGYFFPSRFLDEAALLSNSVFFGLTALAILTDVFKDEKVDFDKISGALCVYLLLGLLWAFFYQILELNHPGSFDMGAFSDMEGQDTPFFYYSLVTMSTLGYGDITPLTMKAASLSAMEAIAGQLYLAVLMARLLGLHIAHLLAQKME